MSSGNVLLSLFKNHNMMMAAANDHVYDAPIRYKHSSSKQSISKKDIDYTIAIQTEIKPLESGKCHDNIKDYRGMKGMESRCKNHLKTKYIKNMGRK